MISLIKYGEMEYQIIWQRAKAKLLQQNTYYFKIESIKMNFLTIFDSLETGIYSLVDEHKFSLENYLIKINNFSICYKIAPPNGVMM